jgi:hypothetical protein
MERPRDDLSAAQLAALMPDEDLDLDGQRVADAADDVSAGTARGEVATLDPRAAPLVEDELLSDAFDLLPGPDTTDLDGPDEDDPEAWLDERTDR